MSESFMPLVFDLDSGAVTAVETSPVDPKVRMDSTGFFATDINGNKISSINPDGTGQFSGAVHATEFDMAAAPGVPGTPNQVRWIDAGNGAIVADLKGMVITNRRSGYIAEAKSEQGSGNVQLILNANSDGLSTVQASVTDDPHGNFAYDIARSDGTSSFALNQGNHHEGFSAGDLKWSLFNNLIDWLWCNGQIAPVGTNLNTLLANLGSPFGTSGGQPRTPDIRGQILVDHNASDPTFGLYATGGEKTHTLTAAESGTNGNGTAQSPGTGVLSGTFGGGTFNIGGGGNVRIDGTLLLNARGADNAHNNLPPFFSTYLLIKT